MNPETSLQMAVTQPNFHMVSSFKYNNNITIWLLIISNNFCPAVRRCRITQTAGTQTESVYLPKADDQYTNQGKITKVNGTIIESIVDLYLLGWWHNSWIDFDSRRLMACLIKADDKLTELVLPHYGVLHINRIKLSHKTDGTLTEVYMHL